MGNVDAISALRVGRFDLAVIDLDLPRAHGIAMTAWELARISRALVANLGLILMAAKRSLEDETLADRLERARLLEKPINPMELGSIVQALLAEYKTSPVSREWNHV
jgi:DNA-binding response OmpR family regulator